ncbi:MAG: phosphatase PAP2 family protein [Actinomycetes bacterium]
MTCVLALTVLSALVAVRWHPLVSLDAHAERSAHTLVLSHPNVERAARDVTQLGDPRTVNLLVLAAAAAAATRRHWRLALLVIAARLIELGVNALIKSSVARPRPQLLHPITHAAGWSFPSGHAAGSAAVYGVIAVVLVRQASTRARYAVIAAISVVVACIAATRVLLGVHYPSDVTGGILVGLGSVAAATYVVRAR